MLKVHHLNNSRSQRVLWLLEELGAPYEIVFYKRMEGLPLAPPELKEIHPLGKSPVITDDGVTVAESGAIIEYLLDRYGNGRMRPKAGTPEHVAYVQWMHYAEGSAMFPQLLALLLGMLGDGGAPLKPYVDMEIEKHLRLHRGRARRPRVPGRRPAHRRGRADRLRPRGGRGRQPSEGPPAPGEATSSACTRVRRTSARSRRAAPTS